MGAAVFLVVEIFVADPASPAGAAFMALLALLAGCGVAAVAAGLARGRRWSRAPAATWQLLQASIALPALGAQPAIGAGLLLLCGIVLAGVLRTSMFEGVTPPR